MFLFLTCITYWVLLRYHIEMKWYWKMYLNLLSKFETLVHDSTSKVHYYMLVVYLLNFINIYIFLLELIILILFFFTTLMILPYIYGILNKVNFVKSLTWCKKECFILQIPNNLDMNLPKCQNFATHISIHPLQASLYICLVQTIIYNFLLQPIACILKVI